MRCHRQRSSLKLAAVVALVLSGSRLAFAQGTWITTMSPMPTARVALGAATGPDGKIYAIGGFNRGGGEANRVEIYDPTTETWTQSAPFPCGGGGVAAVRGLDDKIYALVTSGSGAGFCFQVYDTDTQNWTTLPGIDGLGIQALVAAVGPDGRGRVYAVRGYSGNTQIAEYDPDNRTWTMRAPMPSARLDVSAATGGDGRIYVFGGAGFGDTFRRVEAYDPGTDIWTIEPDMLTSHTGPGVGSGGAAATGPDGRIYVIGGNAGNAVEVLDVTTGSWCSCTSMATERNGLAAVAGPDGLIYAIGGGNFSAGILDVVEKYQPVVAVTWTTTAAMPTVRDDLAATATAGSEGRVYAIGGRDEGGGLTTVESYNPDVGTWEPFALLETPRAGVAAVAMPDGRIFAFGGNGTDRQTAEYYNPTTGFWSPIASLPDIPEPRTIEQRVGGAALGPDDTIYVINCGVQDHPPPINPSTMCFAVAYDPNSDTWTNRASFGWNGIFGKFSVAAGADGRVYVVGGFFIGCFLPTCSPSIELPVSLVRAYDPANDTWTEVARLNTPRWGSAAVTGPDGKIYSLGGTTRDTSHLPTRLADTVEAYDPIANTWAKVGCLPRPRTGLAAATGPDGRIYAIGGVDTGGVRLGTVEAFIP